jgi:hypothetical protein
VSEFGTQKREVITFYNTLGYGVQRRQGKTIIENAWIWVRSENNSQKMSGLGRGEQGGMKKRNQNTNLAFRK